MKVYLFNLQLKDRYRHPRMVRERSFHYEDGVTFDSPEKIYKLAVQALHMNRKGVCKINCVKLHRLFDTPVFVY